MQVGNARRALALMAAKFFPRQPRTIAAVTGTSGKTSVAAFTRQIWTALGHRAASIGTIGIVSPRGETYGSLTTPDPVALHRSLDALAADGVTHLAIEASSHGLDQYRLDGLRIAAAAFTNITRDHLDYHPSFEAYLAAKLRLFEALVEPDGAAVIDVDHDHAETVVAAAERARSFDHQCRTQGDRHPSRQNRSSKGSRKVCRSNMAAKLFACACRWSVNSRSKTRSLPPALPSQPAAMRLQYSRRSNISPAPRAGLNWSVQIAVRRSSSTMRTSPMHLPKRSTRLRSTATGKLVVVFGAGGDRDRGKRPLMGAVAAAKADRVIVTDDNPRSENPAAIRAAIMAAVPGATEIGDRREAIRSAISALRTGDVLLIAGKGHETGQIIGDRVVPFSDHEAVAAALEELAA